MDPLPKLVATHLQSHGAVGGHPDADQLTALMENVLAGPERSRVLDHVATCAECRDVVFTALPQFAPTQEAVSFSPNRGWLRWPVLHWGALAVCAMVVGTAVTLHYQDRTQERLSEATAVPAQMVAKEQDQLSRNIKSNDDAPLGDQPGDSKLKSLTPSQAADANIGRYSGNLQSSYASSSPALTVEPVPQTEQESRSLKEEAKKDRDAVSLQDQARNTMRQQVAEAAPPAGSLDNRAEVVTGKAKEPLEKSDTKQPALNEPAFRADRKTSAVASGLILAPRWTLAADGTLQRSLNGGKTWEMIGVAANVKLRAVTAVGNEIWVGGDGGALYHSSDAGGSWTKVQPTMEGTSLSADVIGLEFVDTQHGKVTTAAGENWTTSDGGQTWRKD
jgi:hypothetical protein